MRHAVLARPGRQWLRDCSALSTPQQPAGKEAAQPALLQRVRNEAQY